MENIDSDLHPDRESAVEAALSDMDGSGVLTVCRGEWTSCINGGEVCPMCARITVTPGLTARDALAQARQFRA